MYPELSRDGGYVGYLIRWREKDEDGTERQPSRRFSARRSGSLDHALEQAVALRKHALRIVRTDGALLRPDRAQAMTVNELFSEWRDDRGPYVSKRYVENVARYWDREIASRSIGRMRLGRLSEDPAAIVRFQDELNASGLTPATRAEILKALRAVLRWGRRRHPNTLRTELSGLFELPRRGRQRLAYVTDAYGIERLIEAALDREVHDDLYALRDAAFIAAMGFTIAARPSEWLYSATWGDVHRSSVDLQRQASGDPGSRIGLKTGARAALLLRGASLRLCWYRQALEDRFGFQPADALVFQVLGPDGPVWIEEDEETRVPLAWDYSQYQGWTARVWRRARAAAARIPDIDEGLESMRFYDCRHTAISLALHSTLVVDSHGMNLHNLAGWAGHDVTTLQRYYAHVIARYHGSAAIALEEECALATQRVVEEPAELLLK